jgi:hypothetical protein
MERRVCGASLMPAGTPRAVHAGSDASVTTVAAFPPLSFDVGFVGDVIDHLRIGRTAFYRYFTPDRIRELRNQA